MYRIIIIMRRGKIYKGGDSKKKNATECYLVEGEEAWPMSLKEEGP
jgi:hypothetical protein